MFGSPINEAEIISSVIRTCNSKLSTDNYGISMNKKTIDTISKPLTKYLTCPLKVSKIIPIFKNGSIELVYNYRSISLLHQFSIILQKFHTIRLEEFI